MRPVQKIVQDYTREAGVRNLERNIGAVCRKGAVRITEDGIDHIHVTADLVRAYLKKERFESELSEAIEIPGIATGLAVTPVGGDILFVEATLMNGKGNLTPDRTAGGRHEGECSDCPQLRAVQDQVAGTGPLPFHQRRYPCARARWRHPKGRPFRGARHGSWRSSASAAAGPFAITWG